MERNMPTESYKLYEVINVSPKDIENMARRNVEAIRGMDMLKLDADERRALEMYMEANQA